MHQSAQPQTQPVLALESQAIWATTAGGSPWALQPKNEHAWHKKRPHFWGRKTAPKTVSENEPDLCETLAVDIDYKNWFRFPTPFLVPFSDPKNGAVFCASWARTTIYLLHPKWTPIRQRGAALHPSDGVVVAPLRLHICNSRSAPDDGTALCSKPRRRCKTFANALWRCASRCRCLNTASGAL